MKIVSLTNVNFDIQVTYVNQEMLIDEEKKYKHLVLYHRTGTSLLEDNQVNLLLTDAGVIIRQST